MFPEVGQHSFRALLRLCQGKTTQRTRAFLEKVWDREALNKMMYLSNTMDIDELVNWLVSPTLEEKYLTISSNINQFK